ncbi:MAG: Gfo/Idh/MocA family protein [Bosea sp. (in: a-proteobacteria)]
MTKSIGWAIIGSGKIARGFAAALKSASDARLVAVMSREPARAAAFAAAAGDAGIIGVTSLEVLLATPGIDIVYIATPNHLHARQAIACLEAGKAVLCEKPLATNADDARAIAEAAEKSGRFCMEAMWTLCLPALAKLRMLIDEGRIGRITQISGGLSYRQSSEPEAGGGALLDLGVYPLAVTLSLLGAPKQAKAVLRHAPSGVDVQAAVALAWEGASAALSCGFEAQGPNDLTITGETGIIRLHGPMLSPALISLTPHRGGAPAPAVNEAPIVPAGNSTRAALQQMLRPFRPGRTKLFPVPYRGNGLIHEIEEAMACMRAGKSQSELVPLSLSISVQETIERLTIDHLKGE